LYYPGIKNQFENGKHLVWFKDEKEAEDLARYYLKNKKERVEIARQGNLLYRAKHKAEHRINNMLDIMQGDTDKFYGYLKKRYEQGLYQDNSQDLKQNSL
jgi:spore maturation protein CgeB